MYNQEGKTIKVVHQYRSTLFFPTFGPEKLVTALETIFPDDKLSFIFRKKYTGIASKYCIDSTSLPVWEYFFFEGMRDQEKLPLLEIEQSVPRDFVQEINNLPGENIAMVLKGKITLVHLGFIKSEHEIKQFIDALLRMAKTSIK
jgi:hypothetical protein